MRCISTRSLWSDCYLFVFIEIIEWWCYICCPVFAHFQYSLLIKNFASQIIVVNIVVNIVVIIPWYPITTSDVSCYSTDYRLSGTEMIIMGSVTVRVQVSLQIRLNIWVQVHVRAFIIIMVTVCVQVSLQIRVNVWVRVRVRGSDRNSPSPFLTTRPRPVL